MDKRLMKRHKRQVARANEKVKLSEPDVRTPEQIKAAREASQASNNRGQGQGAQNSALSFRNAPSRSGGSRTDTGE